MCVCVGGGGGGGGEFKFHYCSSFLCGSIINVVCQDLIYCTMYALLFSMCILASRDHTCIHPEVSKSKTKTDDCRKLLDYDEVIASISVWEGHGKAFPFTREASVRDSFLRLDAGEA